MIAERLRRGARTHVMDSIYHKIAVHISDIYLRKCGVYYRSYHIELLRRAVFTRQYNVPVSNKYSVLSNIVDPSHDIIHTVSGSLLTQSRGHMRRTGKRQVSKPNPTTPIRVRPNGMKGGGPGNVQSAMELGSSLSGSSRPPSYSSGPLQEILTSPTHNQCGGCGRKAKKACGVCKEGYCAACFLLHRHPCEECQQGITCPTCGSKFCNRHWIHKCSDPEGAKRMLETIDQFNNMINVDDDMDRQIKQASVIKARAEANKMENEALQTAQVASLNESTRKLKILNAELEVEERRVALEEKRTLIDQSRPNPLKRRLEDLELQTQIARVGSPNYDKNALMSAGFAAAYLQPRDYTCAKAIKGACMNYLYEVGQQNNPDALEDMLEVIRVCMTPGDKELELSQLLCPDGPLTGKEVLDRLRFNDRLTGTVTTGINIKWVTEALGYRLNLWTRTVPVNGKGQDPSTAVGIVPATAVVRLALAAVAFGACASIIQRSGLEPGTVVKTVTGSMDLTLKLAGFTINKITQTSSLLLSIGTNRQSSPSMTQH